MSHVNETTSEEFLIGVNAFWQFYKQHQYNYPEQFKNYLSASIYFHRLTYIQQLDKWTLIKVSEYNTFTNPSQKKQRHDNSNSNNVRNQSSTVFRKREHRFM